MLEAVGIYRFFSLGEMEEKQCLTYTYKILSLQ